MEFKFEMPQEALDKVHQSFNELCDAHVALKKARRRARIVGTVEKAVLIAAGVAIYKSVKNHEVK